jgi:hypothetical protein
LKLVGARQELRLFQQHSSQLNFQSTKPQVEQKIDPQQQQQQQSQEIDKDTTVITKPDQMTY